MPIEKNNRLIYNFFSLGFVQVINSSLQLLVIPYVIIKIGAEGYGVIAIAQVVMFYLSTFSEYGFNQSATRTISVNRDDGGKNIKDFFQGLLYQNDPLYYSFFIANGIIADCPGF
jgi:O-antigen/teichoic acid export membrane protein